MSNLTHALRHALPSSLPQPTEFPQSLKRFWLVIAFTVTILNFIQITAYFPVLPVYLTERWGEGTPIGLVMGTMAAGVLFLRPVIGWALDKWGRKPVLLIGLGIAILAQVIYLFSPTPWWLLGGRLLHGVSQAMVATASQTLIIDLVAAPYRTAVIGYWMMSNTLAFALGPLLGSYLYRLGAFPLYIQGMLVLAGLAIFLSLSLPWLKPPGHVVSSTPQKPEASPWRALLSFPVREATFFFFVIFCLHGGLTTFLALWVEDAASFYSLYGLGAVFVRFALGRWGHLCNPAWTTSIGLTCLGGSVVGIALYPQYLLFWALFYSLGFGTLPPVFSGIVAMAVPASQRGRVFSLYLMGFDSGMTVGSMSMGWLLNFFGLGSLFCASGIVSMGMALFAFRQFSQPIPIPNDEATSISPTQVVSKASS